MWLVGRLVTRLVAVGGIAALLVASTQLLDRSARAGVPTDGLADPDPRVRALTASRLGASRDRGARAALEQALTDPDSSVRIAVATALCELGDRAAVPALCAAAVHEEDAGVRVVIASAIERLGG
jgi:HEAT repeat protein